jgi:lysophospholipase L1-like esterase
MDISVSRQVFFGMIFYRNILVVMLVFLFFPGLQAQKLLNQLFSPLDSLTIVAFGNSITATRATIDQVFAQRLPDMLLAEGIHCRMINAGIGGSHTGRMSDHDLFKINHARDRFESDVLSKDPDITLIGFGTNDSYIDSKVKNGSSRIPLHDYENNLIYFIKGLQATGSKIILIAPNILGAKYPHFQNKRLLKYVKVVRKLAKKLQTGLVDNYKLFRKYSRQKDKLVDDLMLDGVHPNDKGHELIAQEIMKEIIQIVSVSFVKE